jgi:hypothetical protein
MNVRDKAGSLEYRPNANPLYKQRTATEQHSALELFNLKSPNVVSLVATHIPIYLQMTSATFLG